MQIKQITNAETKKYKLIGRGMGTNLSHCMFMAHRHSPDFEKDVVAYCIEKTSPENMSPHPNIEVSFWETKSNVFGDSINKR